MRWYRLSLALVVIASLGAWLWLTWLESTVADRQYDLIEENLHVGGLVKAPPPGTKAVLNLCQQEDRYTVAVYRAEPIDGSVAPTIDWLKRIVTFIHEQRQAGNSVYIHCFAGMNRSGMVVTAYLMYEHGWSRDEALTFAQSKRPSIQPSLVMMRLLAEWERELNPGEEDDRGVP